MRNRTAELLIAILTMVSAADGHALTPLVVTDDSARYEFVGSLRMVLDETGGRSKEEMITILQAAQPQKVSEPNFGYVKGTVWGLVTITNESALSQYLLYFGYNLSYIDLYVNRGDNADFSSTPATFSGSMIPLSQRPYRHRFAVFPLALEKGMTYTLLMRIRSHGSLSVPISLFAPMAFNEYNEKVNLFFGIMFGLLAGIVLYVLFIIISSRMWPFSYFLLFSAVHLVFQLCFSGYFNLYFLGERPFTVLMLVDVSAALTLIAGLVFAQSFLRTARNAPIIHSLLLTTAIVGAVPVLLAFLGRYKISVTLTNALLLASGVLIGVCAVKLYFQKYKPARFYIYAYASLVVSALVFTGKNFTLVPSTFLSNQSILIGSVIESILLSLAIADTINLLKGENKRFHAQLKESRESELVTLKDKYYRDSMTGLMNRNRMVLDMQRNAESSLFIVNADGFRQINELYGTIIGNKILIEIGRRLRQYAFEPEHEIYRLHSDEFAVVVPRSLAERDLRSIAGRLAEACQSMEYQVDNLRIPIAVTVGVACGEANLLEKADIALGFARKNRRDFAVFSPEIETRKTVQTGLDRIQLLRYAIEHDTVFPIFQPIASNVSGVIEKYEMLMRIRGSDGRAVTPGQYLSVAKRARLYPKLSRSLIRKGLEICRNAPFEFSINISVDDILNRESMDVIRECVDGHPNAKNIAFEILESESIEAYKPVIGFIDEVKRKGCRIAIDDFGSGYSNFNHILNLNVDYLKLDSSLIKTIDRNSNARAVAETISEFGKKLRIKTIAEFVHTKAVRDVVADIGIDYSQGSYIGEPGELVL